MKKNKKKTSRAQEASGSALPGAIAKSLTDRFQWSAVLLAGCLLCAFASGMAVAPPWRYMKVGQIVHSDVRLNEDIVDSNATRQAREKARKDVRPIYATDTEAYRSTEIRYERFFGAMDTLRSDAASLRDQIIRASERDSELRTYEQAESLTSAEWRLVLGDSGHQQLERSYGDWFDSEQIDKLLALPQSNYNSWLRDITIRLNAQLRKGIPEEEVRTIRLNFVAEMQKLTPITVQSVLTSVADYCLTPTMFLDQEATAQAEQTAVEQTPEVVIPAGEPILREGDVLEERSYQIMLDFGTIMSRESMVNRWLSLVALYSIMYLLMSGYLSKYLTQMMMDRREGVMLLLVVGLDLLLAYVLLPINEYYNTAILGVLLISQLISPSAGLLATLLLAPAMGFMSGGVHINYVRILQGMLATFIGASAGVYIVRKSTKRSSVLQGALCCGLGMIAVYAVIAALGNIEWEGFLLSAGCTLGICLVCGILDIGLLPLWEWAFDVATPARLMELSDINHPLLQRLMIEAPGTYNHSVMVGTLAEAAATAVGLNATLTRVGAYFHDIGKLQRPQYFVENQHGYNPHDQLDPMTSAAIIIAHVSDGIKLAKKHGVPRAVCAMIEQHHGDSLVASFYYKAVEKSGNKDLQQSDFRYPGPKPLSKEAAILMLTDSIEAAVRSLPEQTSQSVSERVDKVIAGKLQDRQFSRCDLTMAELEKARLTILQVYDGLLHERVEYPDIEKLRSELAAEGHLSLSADLLDGAKQDDDQP